MIYGRDGGDEEEYFATSKVAPTNTVVAIPWGSNLYQPYAVPGYMGLNPAGGWGMGCVSAQQGMTGLGAFDLSSMGGYFTDALNGAKVWMTPTAIPSFLSSVTALETGKMVATGVGFIIPPIIAWSLISRLMKGGRRRRR